MLHYAIFFFVIALIAASPGFTGIAAGAASSNGLTLPGGVFRR